MNELLRELSELLIWKYQIQMKVKTFQMCLAKMASGKAAFDRIINEKCVFGVKSGMHELFHIDELINEILNEIDISDIHKNSQHG